MFWRRVCRLTQVSQRWSPVNLPRATQALAAAAAAETQENPIAQQVRGGPSSLFISALTFPSPLTGTGSLIR